MRTESGSAIPFDDLMEYLCIATSYPHRRHRAMVELLNLVPIPQLTEDAVVSFSENEIRFIAKHQIGK